MTSGGYNPEYYAPLFAAEDRHFWFHARNTVIEHIVNAETSRLADGYRVLELGCGTGYVLRMLRRACARGRVVGLDLFEEGLRMARHRGAANLVRARLEAPPFSEQFDLVGLFDTLEHIEDDLTALRHVRALVRPGGALMVTVPAYQELWSDFDAEARHCRRYDPAGLAGRLVEAGFDVEYLTPFMATLYPFARVGRFSADALRRWKSASSGTASSAVVEQLTIVPGINGLLSFLLTQEARILARRGHLPFGTSLVALARAA